MFIGCSVCHATILHGVEELAESPYLFEKELVEYILKDSDGRVLRQIARRHNFVLDGVFIGNAMTS